MHSFCRSIPNFYHNFISRKGVMDIFFLVTLDMNVYENKLWLVNECITQINSFSSCPVKNFYRKNLFFFLLLF